MKFTHVFFTTILICIVGAVFGRWFLNQEIIGGDWPYYFDEMLKEFVFFPLSWNPGNGNGLGDIDPLYFLNIFSNFTIVLSTYSGLPWIVVYKIFWFGLFIALSILSSIALLKSTLSNVKYWQLVIGGVIFTSNTYILMIVGGGQMGVALAYSIAPLVLARFIKIIHNSSFVVSHSFIAGLVLAVQVMFDLRIAYITMLAVCMYYVLGTKYYALAKKSIRIAIPVGIAILLHAAWILPIFFLQSNPTPQGITNVDGFRFFSFADFSHTFSLLHPNWPENIFGKVYFMRPEFLFLPILAYTCLLFLKKPNIIFFALLALLGSFLAKGVNPPFGEINQWLFMHIPGMNFFRDPTKFYLLVSLSYSVLIPFSLLQISRIVSSIKYQVLGKKINPNNTYYIIPIIFLVIWLFLIRPAILGQLGGTFQKHKVPNEYFLLKDFLHNQPDFFRTLWIPRGLRFNYFSNIHLVVASEQLFGTRDITKVFEKLHSTETKIYLQALGIKYIIVPFDPMGEIFVKNRKYDEKQYKDTIERLETIPWLRRLHSFGRIAVFEVPHSKDRFWLIKNGNVSYTMINPAYYDVTVSIAEPQSLIFSENYHPSWIAMSDSKTFVSKKTTFGLNSFSLPKRGNYSVKITFAQQKYYKYGQMISMVTLISVFLAIIVFQKKKL
ncbi:MAG: hypothetical protein HYV39_01400 [Candidatus Levybacteria bacterium]|nr:hypothetical protein [Candidatus Levybacteria bacterium]